MFHIAYKPAVLQPPKNPQEAVASRRNPCYGFGAIVDLQENIGLIAVLRGAQDAVLNTIDPDRGTKSKPIKSDLYIKQKFFHASVFAMPPLLVKEDFLTLYGNKNGLLNRKAMDEMCTVLQTHIDTQKPYLEPVRCELMPDGTVLARFAYCTTSKDDSPLLTLSQQLDPNKQFAQWDATNRLRYTTVAVAICTIDKDKLSETSLESIHSHLQQYSEKLKQLGNIDIEHFSLMNFYDKRTWSLKHITQYADVSAKQICKV